MGQVRDLAGAGIVRAGEVCLAIESATPQASVALLRGEQVLASEVGPSGQHHSESLLPMVDRVLSEAGVSLSKVNSFALSIGPGAFTSLRIGLATLKGLAFGSPSMAVGVSTLQVLALSAKRRGLVQGVSPLVAVLDARREEVYAAAYAPDLVSDPNGEAILPPSVYTADELVKALPEGGELVGDGVAVVKKSLIDEGPFSAEPEPPSAPHAVSVGLLGQLLFDAGEGVPAGSLVPRYIRRAEAEAQRTASPLE